MYMKKMPFPAKGETKKAMPKEKAPSEKAPSEKDMALELEIEEGEGEEEPEMEGEELDLKSMMGEGEAEMGPLAEVSDEDLMAELKKRGLMPEGSAAPEAAMPKMK